MGKLQIQCKHTLTQHKNGSCFYHCNIPLTDIFNQNYKGLRCLTPKSTAFYRFMILGHMKLSGTLWASFHFWLGLSSFLISLWTTQVPKERVCFSDFLSPASKFSKIKAASQHPGLSARATNPRQPWLSLSQTQLCLRSSASLSVSYTTSKGYNW